MDNELFELVRGLMDCYEKAYNLYKNDVDYIISNHITDINYIERTLDYILGIYTEKGFILFIKLLIYYRTINLKNANDYLEILKEERKEEYGEFIKRLKK